MKTCRKCGEIKPLSRFVKNKACKQGVSNTCLDCSALKQRTVYSKRYKAKEILRSNKRNEEGKQKVKEYLGGKYICADCGYTNKSSVPFDFHHLDPSTKLGTVAGMYRMSWEKLKAEVDKCVLLCAVCHRLRHDRV